MKSILILCYLGPLLAFSQPVFDQFDRFLGNHAVFGAVDYSDIQKNPAELYQLVELIAAHSLINTSNEYQKAFYLNAYNILVIYQVVQRYPISSPKDVSGFFDQNQFTVAGELLTLDQIEFDKVLGEDQDPRIHFALACAAKGCPYLYEKAYTPESLDQQLDFRTRQISGLATYVFVDEKTERVLLCKIFDWYEDQFIEEYESIFDFLNQYRSSPIPSNYSISYSDYDWALNER
ncbi:MAG: DUF547 domain-containing protein [Bacteroidota bacterium]